jgi:anaerobic magnesium-protoporphyrin IX monomethyl ester cyclase
VDLLLTHGYFMHEDPKELQIRKPYVPLGLLYLCSHLRMHGVGVEVFDTTFASRSDLYSTLENNEPSVLGVYANLMTRKNVIEILKTAKSLGWKTIVGGPEPGSYAWEYLIAGADVVVFGEAELTLQELVPALCSGATLNEIAGIAFLEDGNLRQTKPRPLIPDLNAQPWPARETVDIPRYLRTWREAHGQGSVSFITARGCPYRCRWCSHQVYGHTHRRRKATLVADEVESLLQEYSPDMAWVADDVFTIHKGWLREYAAEMRRRDLHLPFECISRADRIDSEVADLLSELGCFRLWIGSESGSQRILDSMERGVTVEQVQYANEICRERGIQTGMFLMWGYEGETIDDIEATIEHVKRSAPDIFLTTVAYPIKGTPYFDRVASNVVQIKSWAESSDREFVIRGRHSRRFYETADRLLKNEVALSRLSSSDTPHADLAPLQQEISVARSDLHLTAAEVEA